MKDEILADAEPKVLAKVADDAPGEQPRAPIRSAGKGRSAPSKASRDSRAVRERILRVAEEIFANKGYAASTTQEIAQRAGIQKRMLFYYFTSKNQLYSEVLDGFLGGVREIHDRFNHDPGPTGLQEIVAELIQFVAVNPNAVRILIREIMDDGAHLGRIVDRYIGPLFRDGMSETRRNISEGVFRDEDPMHLLVNVGGLTIFYLLITPLLKRVWDRDPLAPETLEARIRATTRFVLDGMVTANAPPAVSDDSPAQSEPTPRCAAGQS